MAQRPDAKAGLASLALSYVFYFAQLGVLVPFLGVFLDGRGLSSVEIGELLGLITLARILGPNLWAVLADKSGRNLLVLKIGSLLTLLSFCLLYWMQGFWQLTLALALMMMFWTAILPQLEVTTLNSVGGDSVKYSRIRMWGSVGYIGFSVFGGWVIDLKGSEALLYSCTVILAGLFLVNLLLKEPGGEMPANEVSGSIWHKLSSKVFLGFIFSALLLQMSFGPYYGFFALYMRDLGLSGQQTGWLIALGVAAEVVVFFYAGSLIRRLGVKWVLIHCLWLTALRWWVLAAWADNLVLLIASQLVHALSFGLIHAASVHFIHGFFGRKYQSRGQALYVSLSFGIGGAIGNYVSGQLWQQGIGAYETYLFAAVAAALSAIILLLLPKQSMG